MATAEAAFALGTVAGLWLGVAVAAVLAWDGKPERPARRLRVTVDERKCIGHDECGACGATVGMADRYCRMCGRRLEG